MEWILTDCGGILADNMPILLSVIVAGVIGSATHCTAMCAPLVAAQMLHLKETKQSQWHILSYHCGRIVIYTLFGALAASASAWLFSDQLLWLMNSLMIIAGALFIISALTPRQTHCHCPTPLRPLRQKIDSLSHTGLVYFMRGILMGFMPCGMVIAVLMLVATLHDTTKAVLLMLIFGLSTLPLLQLTGFGALRLSRLYPNQTFLAGRTMMAIQGCLLCAIGMNLVTVI